MTHQLAAIREAAERLFRVIPRGEKAWSIACEILRLLDEAEADGKCQLEPPDNDIDFPHCSRCACMIQIIEIDSFGETEKVHDDFCPGCGRRIEGGGSK
jgi:hypothetical protein